jgi:hypothetical protein
MCSCAFKRMYVCTYKHVHVYDVYVYADEYPYYV